MGQLGYGSGWPLFFCIKIKKKKSIFHLVSHVTNYIVWQYKYLTIIDPTIGQIQSLKVSLKYDDWFHESLIKDYTKYNSE